MELGEIVRLLRKLKKMTQEELAELSGITRSTVAGIETRKQETTVNSLRRIAVALGVPTSVLLGETSLNIPPVQLVIEVVCAACGPIAKTGSIAEAARRKEKHIEYHVPGGVVS